jgi:hypothetical protein
VSTVSITISGKKIKGVHDLKLLPFYSHARQP